MIDFGLAVAVWKPVQSVAHARRRADAAQGKGSIKSRIKTCLLLKFSMAGFLPLVLPERLRKSFLQNNVYFLHCNAGRFSFIMKQNQFEAEERNR